MSKKVKNKDSASKSKRKAKVARLRQRVAQLEAAVAEQPQMAEAYRLQVDHSTQGLAIIQDQHMAAANEAKLRSRTAQLEALRQIGLELVAELNVDALLHSILSRAVELLEADMGGLYLYRPERDLLELVVSIGSPAGRPGTTLRSGEGLSGHIWATGQPLVVDDYQAWSGRAAVYAHYAFTTVVGVPIQWGQEHLGVLNVANRPTPFSDDDVELLTLLATQAAIALRNAQLVNSLRESEQRYRTLLAHERRQAQELALLDRVRIALAGELDLPALLRTVVEAIAETFGYTLVSLFLLEGDTLVLQHQVGYEHVIPTIPISQGVSGRVVRTGQPVLLEDVHTAPEFLGAIEGIVSEICIPLFDESQVVGCFNIESTQGMTLNQADLELMLALGQHINVALGRARLYQQAQREIVERRQAEAALARQARKLEVLYETSLEINAQTDLSTLLQAIVERAAGLVGVTMGGLYLLQPDNQTLELVISHQLPGDFVGATLRLGEGLSGRVVQTGQPIMIEDYSHWAGRADVFADIPLQRVLGIPLKVKDRIIGVINVADVERTSAFSQEEIRLVSMFADQAAIAIENAHLYQQTRQDAEIKETLLREANHRVKNNLSTIIGLLYAEYRHTQAENQPIFQGIMQNLISRVQGLATVHSLLSATQWTQVSLSQLTRQVIETALHVLPPKQRIQVEVSPSPVQITPRQANNLALVINELTTNTVKYTLTNSQPGRISVTIKTVEEDIICLEFHSSGPGYPVEVLNRQRRNVGLYLVENIVQKGLHGSVTFSNNFGAVTTIIFPAAID